MASTVSCRLLLHLKMFSPFARDLLKPQLFERMDNLMKPIPPVVEDSWEGDYTKFGIFEHKLNSLPSGKSNTFQLFLNANRFQPRDISIKIEDGFIVIHAEHDLKPDVHSSICREFTRRCKIPDNIDPANLSSTFNKNGLLLIKANTKPMGSSPKEETIPIEIQRPQTDNEGLQQEKKKSLDESEIEMPISNAVL